MGTRRVLAGALAAIVMLIGLGACGSSEKVKSLNGVVKATANNRFDPDQATVRLGKETVFVFENDGKVTHNFTIASVFVDLDNAVVVDVKPGESKEVKFTVKDKPRDGFITYYCKYHQNEGMHGKIKVIA